MKRTAEERFWAKVDKNGPLPDYAPHLGPCWIKTRPGSGLGDYTQFNPGDCAKPVASHRFAYELLVGPIPAGLQIDHLCRVPACVNPAHLEPVTTAENQRRGLAPSKIRKVGVENPGAKLDPDRVVRIRQCVAAGERHEDVAHKFGVSRRLVGMIAQRSIWAHVA